MTAEIKSGVPQIDISKIAAITALQKRAASMGVFIPDDMARRAIEIRQRKPGSTRKQIA